MTPASDRDDLAAAGRARIGGTARPSDGSVWDLEPRAAVVHGQVGGEPDEAATTGAYSGTGDPAAERGRADSPGRRRCRGWIVPIVVGLLALGVVVAGWAFVAAGNDAATSTGSGDRGTFAGSAAASDAADAAIDLSALVAAAETAGATGDASIDDATRIVEDMKPPIDDAPAASSTPASGPVGSPLADPPEAAVAETEPAALPDSESAPEGESAREGESAPEAESADPAATGSAEPSPAPDGRRVEIVGRTEACRFGSNCLVAGFELHGFDARSREFVCEFASGARFTFRATTTSVDHACATAKDGDSITIEVDGVRSDTLARG